MLATMSHSFFPQISKISRVATQWKTTQKSTSSHPNKYGGISIMTKFNIQQLISNHRNCTCINPKWNGNKPILHSHYANRHHAKRHHLKRHHGKRLKGIMQKGITQKSITRKGIMQKGTVTKDEIWDFLLVSCKITTFSKWFLSETFHLCPLTRSSFRIWGVPWLFKWAIKSKTIAFLSV